MLKFQKTLSTNLVIACKANPITAGICVYLFYFAFSVLEAMVEKLFFQYAFLHRLDIIFIILFIGWYGQLCYICGTFHDVYLVDDKTKTITIINRLE